MDVISETVSRESLLNGLKHCPREYLTSLEVPRQLGVVSFWLQRCQGRSLIARLSAVSRRQVS